MLPLPPCSWAILAASRGRRGAGQALAGERGGDRGPEPGDQQGAQDGEAEAGAVVADGLGDAGGLAVGVPGGPVDRVGVGLAQHQPHPGAGHDDVDDLARRRAGRSPWPAHSANPAAARALPSTTGRLAPIRSSIRPPICAQTTKPEEEVQDEQAGRGGLLGQGDLPVEGGEEEHRDERHHRDAEDDVLHQERPVTEDAHVDQRRVGPALDGEEHDQQDHAGRDARLRWPGCPSPTGPTAGSRTRSAPHRR